MSGRPYAPDLAICRCCHRLILPFADLNGSRWAPFDGSGTPTGTDPMRCYLSGSGEHQPDRRTSIRV